MAKSGLVRTLISAAPIALIVGCGSDEQGTPLEGAWGLSRSDGCAVLFRYEAGGRCAFGVACELETGDIGIERHEGTCDPSGGFIDASWERSSCETAPAFRVRYKVDGDQLTVDASDARLLFERLNEDGEPTNGLVRYGCWDGDTITFSELREL